MDQRTRQLLRYKAFSAAMDRYWAQTSQVAGPLLFDCGEIGLLGLFWTGYRWQADWYDRLDRLDRATIEVEPDPPDAARRFLGFF